jgi:hypothetical protein
MRAELGIPGAYEASARQRGSSGSPTAVSWSEFALRVWVKTTYGRGADLSPYFR